MIDALEELRNLRAVQTERLKKCESGGTPEVVAKEKKLLDDIDKDIKVLERKLNASRS